MYWKVARIARSVSASGLRGYISAWVPPSNRGKGQKIPRTDFDWMTALIIDNHEDVRAIFKERLAAVATWRNDAVRVVFPHGYDGVEDTYTTSISLVYC